jgi:putative membrane protein
MMAKTRSALNIVLQLILGGVAVLLTSYLLPGVRVEDFFTGVIVAALIALLNITVKPILIILTIPITIFTLGLFLLVINALLILIAAVIVPGFHADGFWWAFLFGLILAIINSLLGVAFGSKNNWI